MALISIVIGLAAFSIGAIVVFLILANLASNPSVTADPNASLAVSLVTAAAAMVPGWLGIIVIALIGVLLLGVVYLFMRNR